MRFGTVRGLGSSRETLTQASCDERVLEIIILDGSFEFPIKVCGSPLTNLVPDPRFDFVPIGQWTHAAPAIGQRRLRQQVSWLGLECDRNDDGEYDP